jgi:hypothetical protein
MRQATSILLVAVCLILLFPIACSPSKGTISLERPAVKYIIYYYDERGNHAVIWCNDFKLDSNIAHVKHYWIYVPASYHYEYKNLPGKDWGLYQRQGGYDAYYYFCDSEIWVKPIKIEEVK